MSAGTIGVLNPRHSSVIGAANTASFDDVRDVNPARENFQVKLPDSLLAKSGKYFRPGDHKKYDPFKHKDVNLPVKHVLSFKLGEELDDILYRREQNQSGARGRVHQLGSVKGLEHYAYNIKLQQLRRLTQPAATMRSRQRQVKLYGEAAVSRLQTPAKPQLYNSKSSLANTVGRKDLPTLRVSPRWTFMYKPEQLFMSRHAHVPPCLEPAKFQVDRTVLPEGAQMVRMMENDVTGARAQLRDYFQIGSDFPDKRVTLGIAYKGPAGCFTTPGPSKYNLDAMLGKTVQSTKTCAPAITIGRRHDKKSSSSARSAPHPVP